MLAKALSSATAAADKLYIEDVMSTFLYTGNGSTQTITNGIDLSGKGGLVWIKSRNNAVDNALFDTTRGAGNILLSNTTDAQGTGYAQSFTSSGFSLANGGTFYNGSAYTYASWTFRKQAKFFDVVTWTGNGTSSRNIAHTLGSTPGFIIVKRTSATADWWCWHRSISTGNLSGNDLILLNSTAAKTNLGTVIGTASSSTFEVGGDSSVNASGGTYVAYLFAHNAGGFGDSGSDSVVSCGSYTGGGTSSSPVVTLGWEPQWVLIKRASGSSSAFTQWAIWDNMRGVATSGQENFLAANYSDAENSTWNATGNYIDYTATGFVVDPSRAGWTVNNTSGDTYIYIAIRRGPMKTPTVGTSVFDVDLMTGAGTVTTGFPLDLTINTTRSGNNRWWISRITSPNGLVSNSTSAESSTSPYFDFASNTSLIVGDWWGGVNQAVYYSFRRAPGFFDVVAYTGTGSTAQSVTHNLGVKPQLVIIKRRSAGTGQDMNWWTNACIGGSNNYWFLGLAVNSAAYAADSFANVVGANREPTAAVFYPWGLTAAGPGGYEEYQTYISYLFATLAGVSKVGSYTGTGTTKQIDCGFTAGARLVLIKRTDSIGNWYIWDTARGIISGDEPHLALNTTNPEVTGTDYIDPLSSGFEISSTAPSTINANGGSFIFLAIA